MKKSFSIDIKARGKSIIAYILKNPIYSSYKIWKYDTTVDLQNLKHITDDEIEQIKAVNFRDIDESLLLADINDQYSKVNLITKANHSIKKDQKTLLL